MYVNGKYIKENYLNKSHIKDVKSRYNISYFTDDFEFCERYNSEDSANNFLNSKYVTEQFTKEFIGARVRKVEIRLV